MPRSKSPDKIVAISHKKGRASELIAKAFLEESGFEEVELSPTVRGPDITCRYGNESLRVEVKSAVKYVRHNKYEFWLTEKVNKPRLDDEMIAIVSPDGRVLLQKMNIHLTACRKDGRRNVTDFVTGRK